MSDNQTDFGALVSQLLTIQGEAAQRWFDQMLPATAHKLPNPGDLAEWMDVARRLQALWLEFQEERTAAGLPSNPLADPTKWMQLADRFYRQSPLANPQHQEKLWSDGLSLWENVLALYGLGSKADLDKAAVEGLVRP